MRLRQLFENLDRTGEGKAAVVGWGRGMGHKGHMYLASSVITQAKEQGADPYFVVSRTVGKDDPITPEEKLAIYKKVFPKHGHIFHTATDEMPDLTRVLAQLNKHGYTDVTVVVGADQVKALSYVKNYNGTPNKAGEILYTFNSLEVIPRQATNDPSAGEEGPRATPMRDILKDPNATDDAKFQAWRDAMSPELNDDEVRDLMHKAQQRMSDPKFGKTPKKEVPAAECAGVGTITKQNSTVDVNSSTPRKNLKAFNLVKEANKVIRKMRAREFLSELSQTPAGKMHGQAVDAGQGFTLFRDVGGYDRVYHLNRMMMATAMADGQSNKPVDMPDSSWFEKYNIAFPFTDEEQMMVNQARATIPTDGGELEKRGNSKEPDDTNKVSPVAKPKRNQYGV